MKKLTQEVTKLGPRQSFEVMVGGRPWKIYYQSPGFYVVRDHTGKAKKYNKDIYLTLDDLKVFFNGLPVGDI